jgi:DNA invertase Pin-like site-specific DNA recombinase
MSQKILSTHLDRSAVVYLRQSSIRQVRENRESTVRQYALGRRAQMLGWPAERIELIDEDLGTSGSSTVGRSGFQRLAEDVSHGRIGAIFALEVSRLARSSADWHRLLELCGLADVVIADEQSVYCPTDYNDRLLLGLKGQMSEAEVYWMRLRLQGGKMNKARRGELAFRPAIGYQWDPVTGRPEMDANREVREAVSLVFERFRIEGSAYGVMRYFSSHGLRLPARAAGSTEVRWMPPRPEAIQRLLHNPLYAGAYAFGRHQHRRLLVDGELRSRTTRVPLQRWAVCLKDHHPGYITWEEFMDNQRRLADNCSKPKHEARRGAPREGHALLQGLVLCGKCGSRMSTSPQGKGRNPLYLCRSPILTRGEGRLCWMVTARAIDEAVAKLGLEAVCPEEIELGLAVLQEAEQQAGKLRQQWKLRLDSAAYEARLAERRYKAVDPDNRTVASTLERAWEEKLRDLHDLEAEYQAVVRRRKLELGPEDRRRILELSRDLPGVWRAQTTTPQQRKTLLRLLFEQVTLSPIDAPVRATRVQVLWQTGAVSELCVGRPSSDAARAASKEAVERIRELVLQTKSDPEIAGELNDEGYQTGDRRPWSAGAVRRVRARVGLRKGESLYPQQVRRPDRREDGLYSMHGVSARLGIAEGTVRDWYKKGLLEAVEGGRGQGDARWFRIDEATLERIEQYRASNRDRIEKQLVRARRVQREMRDKQKG